MKYILLFLLPFIAYAQNTTRFLISEGKFFEAKEALMDSIQINPDKADFYYELSLAHKGLFRYRQAVAYASMAVGLDSANVYYGLNLAELYRSLSLNKLAITAFENTLNIDNANISAMLGLAETLMEENYYNDAAVALNNLLKIDSSRGYIFKLAGIANIKTGNKEVAWHYLNRASFLNQQDIDVYVLLGKLYQSDKQLMKALTVVQTGLEFSPDNYSLLKLESDLLYALNKYTDAENVYERLIMRGDSSVEVTRRLGFVKFILASQTNDSLSASKKYLEAVNFLGEAYNADSTDPNIPMYIGLSYDALGDYPQAVKYLEESMNILLPETIGQVYTYLGGIHDKTGEYDKAIRAFQNARKYDKGNTAILFRLAAVYDSYYSDKTISKNFYTMYLEKADSTNKLMIDYAQGRVDQLTEELHMRK